MNDFYVGSRNPVKKLHLIYLGFYFYLIDFNFTDIQITARIWKSIPWNSDLKRQLKLTKCETKKIGIALKRKRRNKIVTSSCFYWNDSCQNSMKFNNLNRNAFNIPWILRKVYQVPPQPTLHYLHVGMRILGFCTYAFLIKIKLHMSYLIARNTNVLFIYIKWNALTK